MGSTQSRNKSKLSSDISSDISSITGTQSKNTTLSKLSSDISSSTSGIRDQYHKLTRSYGLFEKIGFLLFVIIVYVVLMKISINLLVWALGHSSTTTLVKGTKDAKTLSVFSQNPLSGNTPLFRSINERDGIEFTWSVWIFISGLTYNEGKYKTVFYKGNDNVGPDGINTPNNAPGLYIAPHTNELIIHMNTFTVIDEKIKIPNIPMNKWVNVVIRCEGKKLDVYINGIVARSIKLAGVPKQNYGDVYVGANGGFDGYISNLTYHDTGINIGKINEVVKKGPNLTMYSSTGVDDKDSSYLSMRWYK